MISQRNPYFGGIGAFENKRLIEEKKGVLLPSEDYKSEYCQILYIPSGIKSDEAFSCEIDATCSRLLIILEEGASAHASAHLACSDSESIHITEIFLADNAELSLLFAQKSDAQNLTIRQRSSIGANAKLHLQNVSLGTGELHHDLLSDVEGAESESSIDWLFYSKDKEHQKINARNVFHAKNGRGEIVMKGVAEDKAHSVCTGMIDIGLGGGGTDTYLTEEVLMLDKTAKVDAVPGLEIKTNDVKASHSATVSKVTVEDLFYFASRGISESEAREMYVRGFLGGLTERIANEKERTAVLDAIERKYQG